MKRVSTVCSALGSEPSAVLPKLGQEEPSQLMKERRRPGPHLAQAVAREVPLYRTPERRSAAGVKSSAVRSMPNWYIGSSLSRPIAR